jgi:cell division protein FtsL
MTNNNKTIIGILVIAVIVLLGYVVLNQPDQRSLGDKIEDAASQLDEGVDDAARELEDRTPAERVIDEVEDATDGSPE